MRLGTAIELLIDNYRYASDKEWIQDKVAWALYHTWKEADRKTEPTISKMEQVDKDINVRSKDEPQTNKGGCSNCAGKDICTNAFTEVSQYCGAYEPKDEQSGKE